MAKTELFGTSWCEYTGQMRDWLEWRGVDYVEYDVERDAHARQRMAAIAPGEPTVPMLVEDGNLVQVGWHGRGCTVA